MTHDIRACALGHDGIVDQHRALKRSQIH